MLRNLRHLQPLRPCQWLRFLALWGINCQAICTLDGAFRLQTENASD